MFEYNRHIYNLFTVKLLNKRQFDWEKLHSSRKKSTEAISLFRGFTVI